MAEKICPMIKAPCLEHGCHFYVHLIGQNPQTKAAEDKWGCTFAWLPILMIEGTQQNRQTGAAVESMRNESAKQNVALGIALRDTAEAALAAASGVRPAIDINTRRSLFARATGVLRSLGKPKN